MWYIYFKTHGSAISWFRVFYGNNVMPTAISKKNSWDCDRFWSVQNYSLNDSKIFFCVHKSWFRPKQSVKTTLSRSNWWIADRKAPGASCKLVSIRQWFKMGRSHRKHVLEMPHHSSSQRFQPFIGWIIYCLLDLWNWAICVGDFYDIFEIIYGAINREFCL